MTPMPEPSTCDHLTIPCSGGLRHWFRAGWMCVRCDTWFPVKPDA